MRIVLLSETFSEKMGYLENVLPKYLSQLGADVHVISANLPPNFRLREYSQTYGKFDDGSISRQPGNVERLNGFTLHVLGHRYSLGYIRLVKLFDKLRELRPDVVQLTASVGQRGRPTGTDWRVRDAGSCRSRYFPRLPRPSCGLD